MVGRRIQECGGVGDGVGAQAIHSDMVSGRIADLAGERHIEKGGDSVLGIAGREANAGGIEKGIALEAGEVVADGGGRDSGERSHGGTEAERERRVKGEGGAGGEGLRVSRDTSKRHIKHLHNVVYLLYTRTRII